jgi:hypothetical protein
MTPTETTSRIAFSQKAPATQKARRISTTPEPPEVELPPRSEGDRHVEDPLEEEDEADCRRQRREGVVRMQERPEPGDDEHHAQDAACDLPAPGRDGDLNEFVHAGDDGDDPEQERDRVHRCVVPLEDEQRKDQPGDSGQEEQPPAPSILDDLTLFEQRVEPLHRASFLEDVVYAVAKRLQYVPEPRPPRRPTI